MLEEIPATLPLLVTGMDGNPFVQQEDIVVVPKNECLLFCIIMKIFLFLGSIEVTIATMTKADRSHTDEIYVVGFVPCHQLPNKRPNYLDPILHPLLSEIEDSFISGKSAD